MNPFHEKALDAFAVSGPSTKASYVSVPVSWSENTCHGHGNKILLSSPLEKLADDKSFTDPYLCLVVGPAGVGKSEFIRQLCLRGIENAASRPVFPIRLASCRMPGSNTIGLPQKAISAGTLSDFLFSSLAASAQLSPDTFAKDSFEAIVAQDMILVLDGLDEVIASRAQHLKFWNALWALLKSCTAGQRTKLVVTCRTDYLASLGIDHRSDFGDFIDKDTRVRVHFFRLDFFSSSNIRDYLRSRGVTDKTLQELADRGETESSGIAEIMQRPLLLKLLCDLRDLGSPPNQEGLPSDPTQLLNQLTHQAEIQNQSAHQWSRDGLAEQTLNLFKQQRRKQFRAPEFRVSEIASFLRIEPDRSLSNVELLSAIHLCPFLRRDSEDTVQFTHEVFFEYFVARGMYLPTLKDNRWIDFDRYVLTPDIRRFLRGLLGESVWKDRTARSYAMHDEEELRAWPDPIWAASRLSDLERIRFQLLEFMTMPEAAADLEVVIKLIDEYFDLKRELLFPTYRMYNLEATGVFVWTYRWNPRTPAILATLEQHLLRVLQEGAAEYSLHENNDLYQDSLERLTLRAIDIGLRLRIVTVMKQSQRPASFDWIRHPDTYSEVQALIADIANVLKRAS